MPSLQDPLPDDQQKLLEIVAQGYSATGGTAPVWQWVRLRAADSEVDAASAFTRLPTWQYNYRPAWTSTFPGTIPTDDTQVHLTVVGLAHIDDPTSKRLLKAFLTALDFALRRAREVKSDPRHAVSVAVGGEELAKEIHARTGTFCNSDELRELLRHEPLIWNGVSGGDAGPWAWEVTDAFLPRFLRLRDVQDYLRRLEDAVALPLGPPPTTPLPPLALPEALDHLNLAWRLAFDTPLMRVPRAAVAAKLALPAAGGEEFESRCSALADLLKTFRPPEGEATLFGIQTYLRQRLGKESGRAVDAVSQLRDVLALRAGQQHTGADERAARARSALSLTRYDSDFTGAWERLRFVVVSALTAIREELEPLLPQ